MYWLTMSSAVLCARQFDQLSPGVGLANDEEASARAAPAIRLNFMLAIESVVHRSTGSIGQRG